MFISARRPRHKRLVAALAATYHPRKHFRLGQDIGWHWQIDDPNLLYRRRNRLTYTNDLSAISLGNLTRTLGASTTPDGTSATRLAVTVSTTSTIANTGAAITSTSAIARMFVMVKQVSGTPGARFLIRNSTTASDGDAITINYTTGAVTGSGAITQGVSHSLGSGWWLLVLTRTTGLTAGDGVICYFGWLGDVAITAGAAIDIAKVQLDFGDATTSQAAVQAAYQPVPTTWPQAHLDAVGAERIFAWTDTVGTIPVTAIGDGIGLLLGREYGGARGVEMASANYATAATYDNVTTVVSASAFTQTVGTTLGRTYLNLTTVVGKTYEVSSSITTTDASGILLYARTLPAGTGTILATSPSIASGGTARVIFTATTTWCSVLWSTQTVARIVNATGITVREIPGTHLTQATGTAKPTLSARVNLLTYTEQFDNAYWSKTACSVTANVDGTADKIVEDGTTAAHLIASASQSLVSGSVYVFKVRAKAAERSVVQLVPSGSTFSGPVHANFDLSNGTVSASGGAMSTSISAAGNGYYDCELRATCTSSASSGPLNIVVQNSPSAARAAAYAGDGTSGILVAWADVRTADDAAKNLPAYQRVGATASDHDTDGFPHYAEGDGTDNCWASVATVDGSATDKLTVVTAVTKNSDAAGGMLMELTASYAGNAGSFYITAPEDAGTNRFATVSRGGAAAVSTQRANATGSTYLAPITAVVGATHDISGDRTTLELNGSLISTAGADKGAGNFANATLYVLSRAGASVRFNGRFYGSTGRFGPMSDSERNNLTRWWQKRIGTA